MYHASKHKLKGCGRWIALMLALSWVLFAGVEISSAIELTPEQLKLVEQLSPAEKAKLAAQLGVKSDVQASTPQTDGSVQSIKPRKPGRGPLEHEIGTQDTDQRQQAAEIRTSPATNLPIAQTATQAAAERLELKRAFADFVAESKPLTVDASHLQQFGYDLFAGEPSTFAPVTDVPVPAEYVLGPGDEIKVQLYGQMDEHLSLVLDRNGEVAFPGIGPIALAGMSFGEAKKQLEQMVREKLTGTTANITIGRLRSIRVFALGEVARPGSYVVSGLATLSHALMVSGGVKKTGSLRRVQLKRQGKQVAAIDLYDFLLHGDTSRDVRLLPGDVVFVPRIGQTVGVAGQVLRPAIYELRAESNVGELLHLAGGLLPKAYRDKALIERINPQGEKQVISIALKGRGLKTRLRNGDVLKVFSTIDFEENPVLLIGNVKRPGKYAWHRGMKLSELIPSRDALLPETFMDYGVIEREAEDNREPTIVRFRLQDLFAPGKQKMDVTLHPRDKVYVFHRAHFRVVPQAMAVGSVKSPGTYEIKRNMRLSDLIMAAGGLTRDSYMDEAELYRTDPESKEVHVRRVALRDVMLGEKSQNVLLQDLDRLVVHSIWEVKQKYPIHVLGEVNKPGEYTLAAGMRVADAIFAAGHVTERAYLKKAEITHYEVVDGEKRVSRHLDVDLQAALRGDAKANVPLEPYDVLFVRRVSNWRVAEHVTLRGEVLFPGEYPIEEGEHLSSLLERAGGFTDKAYLDAAVFTRASIREEQQSKLQAMASEVENEIARLSSEAASVSDPKLAAQKQAAVESARKILAQLQQARASGRLVIQLKDLRELKGSEFDVTLRDGDALYVPKRPDEVLVMGQVYNNTALLYQKHLDVDDYIARAGGPTRLADKHRTYVVHANGVVEPVRGGWNRVTIRPGDAIVVPEDLEPFNLLDSALDWSKVLYQVGVAVASMKVIGVL